VIPLPWPTSGVKDSLPESTPRYLLTLKYWHILQAYMKHIANLSPFNRPNSTQISKSWVASCNRPFSLVLPFLPLFLLLFFSVLRGVSSSSPDLYRKHGTNSLLEVLSVRFLISQGFVSRELRSLGVLWGLSWCRDSLCFRSSLTKSCFSIS
jgi:hypothetical protein